MKKFRVTLNEHIDMNEICKELQTIHCSNLLDSYKRIEYALRNLIDKPIGDGLITRGRVKWRGVKLVVENGEVVALNQRGTIISLDFGEKEGDFFKWCVYKKHLENFERTIIGFRSERTSRHRYFTGGILQQIKKKDEKVY